MFKFEKLTVWQKAVNYAKLIYQLSEEFPSSERFGLQSQLRRAAVSIALNIAEGSGRTTNKEFRKFLHDALGSLRESVTALIISLKLGFLTQENFNKAYNQAIEISKMIYSLEKSLKIK